VGLQDVARYGRAAAKLCTSRMQAPNSLAFESVKLRSVYSNKKRYAALEVLMVLPGERLAGAIARGKVSYKGLESKRRDNAPIGSETQATCLKMILKEGDVDGAQQFVCKTISDLLNDRVDLSQLVISKQLSDKVSTKQTHVELTKRITKRSRYTGEIPPEMGDRVNYIMTAGTLKGSKAYELSEDPVVVMESGAPIDINYYIMKQIAAATLRVFTAVWEPNRCKDIKSNMSMKKLRTLKAYQLMFRPELPHMLKKTERDAGIFGIGRWAVPLPKCGQIGCRKRLGKGESIVCNDHSETKAYADVLQEEERRVQLNTDRWDTCRKCAGGGFNEVTCSNVTCDNFFARRKTQLDIEDIQKDVRKFAIRRGATGSVAKFPVW